MILPPVLPHVQAGRVRALAVTADKRASVVPDVPTMAILGFDVIASTPEQFAVQIRADVEKWGKVIRNAGMKAD